VACCCMLASYESIGGLVTVGQGAAVAGAAVSGMLLQVLKL
jgi:hypothetical protein